MAFGLVSTGLWSTIALSIYAYLYAIPIVLLRISIIIITIIIQIILMSIGVGIVSRHHWTRRQLNLINMKTWKSWCLFLIPLFSGVTSRDVCSLFLCSVVLQVVMFVPYSSVQWCFQFDFFINSSIQWCCKSCKSSSPKIVWNQRTWVNWFK